MRRLSITSIKAIYPWQNEQWLELYGRISKGSLPHAILLNGIQGLGKLQFAYAVAASAICDKRESDGFACGNCKQCRLIMADTHPDLRIVQSEEGSTALKIESIRNLVDFIGQTSTQGGLKVAIIYPAEALTLNAANALLKNLEEPSNNSLIILISHSAGMLLPTIRSRCQLVSFDIPSSEVATDWLKQKLMLENGQQVAHYSDKELGLILGLGLGAPLKAEAYLSENILQIHNAMLDELALVLKNELLSSTVAKSWSDDLAKERLAWTISWLEKIIQLRLTSSSQLDDMHHGGKMMSYLAGSCSEKVLFELHATSLTQYQHFLGPSNPNKQLAFESLLNKWLVLMKKSD